MRSNSLPSGSASVTQCTPASISCRFVAPRRTSRSSSRSKSAVMRSKCPGLHRLALGHCGTRDVARTTRRRRPRPPRARCRRRGPPCGRALAAQKRGRRGGVGRVVGHAEHCAGHAVSPLDGHIDDQRAVLPHPTAASVRAVMNALLLEARNTMTWAISSGLPDALERHARDYARLPCVRASKPGQQARYRSGPGATTLTRTPAPAASRAADFVSPSTACLLAAYTEGARPVWPKVEDTCMMPTALRQHHAQLVLHAGASPSTLVSKVAAYLWRNCSVTGPAGLRAGGIDGHTRRPKRATVCSTRSADVVLVAHVGASGMRPPRRPDGVPRPGAGLLRRVRPKIHEAPPSVPRRRVGGTSDPGEGARNLEPRVLHAIAPYG